MWSDRYHLTVAKGLKQISRLLQYVFENFRKHTGERPSNELNAIDWDDPTKPDPCTSAQYLREIRVYGLELPKRPPEDRDSQSTSRCGRSPARERAWATSPGAPTR